MSGYLCPHCTDIINVFGQGGGEDFCRREEERKHSTVEGEGGGCGFLGRIPIDRELVGLLDGSISALTVDDPASSTPESPELATPKPKNIVERYSAIPSSAIVKTITEQVIKLINEQGKKELAERIASGL